jgi:hypothetical protein
MSIRLGFMQVAVACASVAAEQFGINRTRAM